MPELKKCNSCGKTNPHTQSFCIEDGAPLAFIDTLVGFLLDGRYRLDSLIGAGGMGEVYQATHIHLDTEVAIKLLKPEFGSDQTALKRFHLEAKAAGRIQHPNAVRVTDFGVSPEGMAYLVMERIHGQSLSALIRQTGQLGPARAVNITSQICRAVEAAHNSGVIHRDLKPDNILIETGPASERVKVLDFGIAKLKEGKTGGLLTQEGMIIGTPQYMSPEQCQCRPLDPRSDLYSIGILLYEMLTGKVPLDGESTLQVVYSQRYEKPRPVNQLSPHVPPELAETVMRALEKEPEQRQSSVSEFREELERAFAATAGDSVASTMHDETLPDLSRHSAKTELLTTAGNAASGSPSASLPESFASSAPTTPPNESASPAAPANNQSPLLYLALALVVFVLLALVFYFVR